MSSTRFTNSFFVVSSNAGSTVQKWNKIRKTKANGPFVKVHRKQYYLNADIIPLAHLKSDNVVSFRRTPHNEQKLYISNPVGHRDIRTEDGSLIVQLVEVSSYSKETTKEIYDALFASTTMEPLKTTLRVDSRVANQVIPILIGRGGTNIRRLVGNAKAYTMEDDRHLFYIQGTTQKDILSAKINLRREIDRITANIQRKKTADAHHHHSTQTQTSTHSGGAFSELAEESEDEDDDEDVLVEFDHDEINFPTLSGPPPTLLRQRSSFPNVSLAEKLEDAITRGETMDGTEGLAEIQKRRKVTTTTFDASQDTDDEMPELESTDMTTDQIFDSAVFATRCFTGSDEEAEWS